MVLEASVVFSCFKAIKRFFYFAFYFLSWNCCIKKSKYNHIQTKKQLQLLLLFGSGIIQSILSFPIMPMGKLINEILLTKCLRRHQRELKRCYIISFNSNTKNNLHWFLGSAHLLVHIQSNTTVIPSRIYLADRRELWWTGELQAGFLPPQWLHLCALCWLYLW